VALDALPDIFSSRRVAKHKEEEALKAALYQQIGQLKVELDWLKKKWDWSVEQKRQLIEPGHPHVSLRRLPAGYWHAKIEGNIVRDKARRRLLRKSGWQVLRIWEHQLKKSEQTSLERIKRFLAQ
jgi:G:T-mismatch repair DNA endonuclease (very short patch repair protein)